MTVVKCIILFLFLGICSYTDIRKRTVYISCLTLFFLPGLIFCVTSGKEGIVRGLLGMAAGTFLLLVSFATGGAFGEGDALVLMVTGVFLGAVKNTELLCLSLFLSSVTSAGALILKKWGRDTEIPFLPFIFAAHILMTVFEYAQTIGGSL